MPDRETIEERLISICRRMVDRGLIVAREGNVSCRVGPDRILITPAGKSKGSLRAQDLVTVDGSGRKRGGRWEPSSELPMHLALYEEQPDVRAVVHGHPPTATGFAVAGVPLADCVLPEVVVSLGSVPIAPYATPSTRELADSVRGHARAGRPAMLLKNHGAVACGADLDEAFERLETIEQFARIVLTARLLGRVETLSPGDVERLLGLARREGSPGSPWKCEACDACTARRTLAPQPSQPRAEAEPDRLAERVFEVVRRRLGG